MKFTLIVIGMVALAVLFAGCAQQESKSTAVENTATPVYTDSITVVGNTDSAHMYDEGPVVSTGDNTSYQLTGAEVQGCKIAAYSDKNGVVEMRNAPDNPVGCPTNAVGKV